MKKTVLLLFVLYSQINCYTQSAHDVGLFLGGASYIGDLNSELPLYFPRPAVGLLYRIRYNPRYNLRFGALISELQASDGHFIGASNFQKRRGYDFRDNTFVEGLGQLEFNFFPITDDRHADNFSPYVAIGLALFLGSQESHNLQLTIPGTIGVKYKLTKKFEILADFSLRKTFTDHLDGLSPVFDSGFQQYKQSSMLSSKDWYSVYGITIFYTFKDNKNKCHAGYNKRRK